MALRSDASGVNEPVPFVDHTPVVVPSTEPPSCRSTSSSQMIISLPALASSKPANVIVNSSCTVPQAPLP